MCVKFIQEMIQWGRNYLLVLNMASNLSPQGVFNVLLTFVGGVLCLISAFILFAVISSGVEKEAIVPFLFLLVPIAIPYLLFTIPLKNIRILDKGSPVAQDLLNKSYLKLIGLYALLVIYPFVWYSIIWGIAMGA